MTRRNLKRYYRAWELRQQGLIFNDIGKIMGITGNRAAVLSNYVDFKINNQKHWRISNELKEIIKKCRFQKSERGENRRSEGTSDVPKRRRDKPERIPTQSGGSEG